MAKRDARVPKAPLHRGILEDAKLRDLREAMQKAEAQQRAPLSELLALQTHLSPGQSLHLDFRAGRVLGQPLVVLRTHGRREPSWWAALSRREQEVAKLVAKGLRNCDIAAHLGIALSTTKDHVHQVLKKSGHTRRAQIASELQGGSTDDS